MAKDKKEKPVLNLDDKEYIIEDMTDEQKMRGLKRIREDLDDEAHDEEEAVEDAAAARDTSQRSLIDARTALDLSAAQLLRLAATQETIR